MRGGRREGEEEEEDEGVIRFAMNNKFGMRFKDFNRSQVFFFGGDMR